MEESTLWWVLAGVAVAVELVTGTFYLLLLATLAVAVLVSWLTARFFDAAIARTRSFFESLGVPTRLGDYQLGADAIDPLVAALEKHGMTQLGEKQDITPDVSRQILQAAL